MMIDRDNRNRLAERVRHLANGRITTDAFAEAGDFSIGSEDAGVRHVYEAADALYDDFCCYRFRGLNRLSAEQRRQLTIACVFLYTDLEYIWPDDDYPRYFGDHLLMLLCVFHITSKQIDD